MGRNRREEEDLQNPDNWDFEQAEEQLPTRPARAVVSVAFTREDFDRVAARAEEKNKRISTMIREIVLATFPAATQASFTVSIGSSDAQESDALGSWQPTTHQDGTAVLAPR